MKTLIVFSVALTLGLMLVVILTALTMFKLTLEFVAFCFSSLLRPFRARAPKFLNNVHQLPTAPDRSSGDTHRRKAS